MRPETREAMEKLWSAKWNLPKAAKHANLTNKEMKITFNEYCAFHPPSYATEESIVYLTGQARGQSYHQKDKTGLTGGKSSHQEQMRLDKQEDKTGPARGLTILSSERQDRTNRRTILSSGRNAPGQAGRQDRASWGTDYLVIRKTRQDNPEHNLVIRKTGQVGGQADRAFHPQRLIWEESLRITGSFHPPR